MAKKHVLRLGSRSWGFYDPDTGLSLSLGNPQGEVSADRPLSHAIKTALTSGRLVDVSGTTKPQETPKAKPAAKKSTKKKKSTTKKSSTKKKAKEEPKEESKPAK